MADKTKSKTDKKNDSVTSEKNGGTSGAGLDAKTSDEGDELNEKSKAGFQKALQEAREKEKRLAKEVSQMRSKLKEKELAELGETERLEKEAQQLAEENARLKLQQFISKEVQARDLDVNDPLVEILMDTPWQIPPVRRVLGDSPTWDEVIEAVENKLPSYLDDLVARRNGTGNASASDANSEPDESEEEQEDDESSEVPTSTERTVVQNSAENKRTWTRSEIAALSDEDYVKNLPSIRKAQRENRILDK
jgi:hypothetical protein